MTRRRTREEKRERGAAAIKAIWRGRERERGKTPRKRWSDCWRWNDVRNDQAVEAVNGTTPISIKMRWLKRMSETQERERERATVYG